jgi:hypothetical protein
MWGHIPRRGKEDFGYINSMMVSRGQIMAASLARKKGSGLLRKRNIVNALRGRPLSLGRKER